MFAPSQYPIKHVVFEVRGGRPHDELAKAIAEMRELRKEDPDLYPMFPEEGWDENIVQRIVDRAALGSTRDRGIKKAGPRSRRR